MMQYAQMAHSLEHRIRASQDSLLPVRFRFEREPGRVPPRGKHCDVGRGKMRVEGAQELLHDLHRCVEVGRRPPRNDEKNLLVRWRVAAQLEVRQPVDRGLHRSVEPLRTLDWSLGEDGVEELDMHHRDLQQSIACNQSCQHDLIA